jgi:stage II sporulation protein D
MLRTVQTKKKNQQSWWVLFSDHGFVLHSPGKEKHCLLRKNKSLLVRYQNGQLFINGTHIRDTNVYVYPVSGSIVCDGQEILALRLHQWPDVGIALVRYGFEPEDILYPIVTWHSAPLIELALPDISYLPTMTDMQAEDPLALRVRVLLDEKKVQTGASWTFATSTSSGKFKIVSSDGDSRKKMVSKVSQLIVTEKNGYFHVNGKRTRGTHLFLESDDGHITFGGNTYKGLLWLVKDDAQIMVINCLEIEDYVCSVLRTESWPGWPLEINKVMAIASRTYVVSMVLNAKKNKRLYHVKNTNEHQTYSGIHSCPVIKCAVEETRGIFLSHDDKPIVAMFDSCCGGVVPAHIDGVNFNDAPYLAREYACTYCKRCKIYSWQAAYSFAELESMIQKHIPTFKKLHTIDVVKNDKAGLVQEAALHGLHKSIVTGKKLYALLPGVKSFCFSVKKNEDEFIFQGRGYGHHLGLCQWGAREMVRDGWDYKRILQFYYPKTEFMRLM